MQWIIEQLDEGAPLSIGCLMEGVAGRLDEATVRDIIPRLKQAGGEGIVEYPLNKIVL